MNNININPNVASGSHGQYNNANTWKMNETLAHGYSSEYSEIYPMNTNWQGLDGFQISLRLCALGERSLSIWRDKGTWAHKSQIVTHKLPKCSYAIL